MAKDYRERLELLQDEAQDRAKRLFDKGLDEGLDIFIVSSLRTFKEQRALYALGRTKPGKIVTNAEAGESYHNFGLAFDFAVLKSGALIWDPGHREWKRFVALAKKQGFEWGGDWDNFKDYPHLQLKDAPSLSTLRKNFPKGWSPGRTRAVKTWRARNKLPLRRGDGDGRRNLVSKLQRKLRIVVDGEFGEQTEKAVRRWQRTHDENGKRAPKGKGLPATGVVDDATWSAIISPRKPEAWLRPFQIARAVGAATPDVAENWPSIEDALEEVGLNDRATKIAAAATVVVEVGTRFAPIKEFGNKAYFTRMYEGRSDLGNDKPGDGARFHGRGYIQLTGRANYRDYGQRLGIGLERKPDIALQPMVSARILAEYFRRREIQVPARRGDWEEVRRRVNGGLNGWPTFERAVRALVRASQS